MTMDRSTLIELRNEHADNLQRLRRLLNCYVKIDVNTPESLRNDLRKEERYIAALDEVLASRQ